MPESTLFKKKLWHSCFPVSFAKFLRTPSLQNTSGRLPLFLPDSIHQYYVGQRGGCRFKETLMRKTFYGYINVKHMNVYSISVIYLEAELKRRPRAPEAEIK